jgi:hypothetical protein
MSVLCKASWVLIHEKWLLTLGATSNWPSCAAIAPLHDVSAVKGRTHES